MLRDAELGKRRGDVVILLSVIEALDEDIKKLRENGTIKKILEKYGIDPVVGEPGAPSEL